MGLPFFSRQGQAATNAAPLCHQPLLSLEDTVLNYLRLDLRDISSIYVEFQIGPICQACARSVPATHPPSPLPGSNQPVNQKRAALRAEVKKHVQPGAALYTEALTSYSGLAQEYAHQVLDHAVAYADGGVHTNGLENFWSLLKRGISGTYVSAEPFHLFRYLDEQALRFSNRTLSDAERFDIAVRQVVEKRLTFAALT